jgi:hypothetical protein
LKNKTSILYTLVLLLLIITSCHKSVFVHEDHLGASSFTLFKENFRYREKTRHSDLKVIGKYFQTDTTIVFEWREKDKIPYHYFVGNIQPTISNVGKDHISLTVIDKVFDQPVPFATVLALDRNGNRIGSNNTGIRGKTTIKKKEKLALIEVNFLGLAPVIIDYSAFQDYDLTVEMEALKPGGRETGTCLIVYQDGLVEYRIPEKVNFNSFDRNGVVFKKVVEKNP